MNRLLILVLVITGGCNSGVVPNKGNDQGDVPATADFPANNDVPASNDVSDDQVAVDRDDDGVSDDRDACLDTPPQQQVGRDGCSSGQIDSDGDGFSDRHEVNVVPGTDPFDPTDNPDNVRDSDDDGCSDYDETHFEGYCDNDPRTPQ